MKTPYITIWFVFHALTLRQSRVARSERLTLFNAWVQEAISLPNSTFSIWIVGSARNQYRHYFTACVPTQWPAPVSQAKANFIARTQQSMRGTQIGLAGAR